MMSAPEVVNTSPCDTVMLFHPTTVDLTKKRVRDLLEEGKAMTEGRWALPLEKKKRTDRSSGEEGVRVSSSTFYLVSVFAWE